jgi:hypothetical protein
MVDEMRETASGPPRKAREDLSYSKPVRESGAEAGNVEGEIRERPQVSRTTDDRSPGFRGPVDPTGVPKPDYNKPPAMRGTELGQRRTTATSAAGTSRRMRRCLASK